VKSGCLIAVLALFGPISVANAQNLPDAPSPSPDAEKPLTIQGAPLRILHDGVGIFTSPARVQKSDLKWLLPLAGATAASLATDTYTMRHVVTHDGSVNSAAANTSEVLRGTAIAAPILLYIVGKRAGDNETREIGLLGGEAMIDAFVFSEIVKYATLRERPYQDNARGHFFQTDSISNPSFLSGHSIVAWSSAAVLTEKYTKPWEQVGIYTVATGTSFTRVLGQKHFPTDVLVGSAAGWLIGRYVYHAHHKPKRVR
jgi:membrane-associated phospholipid phosphatase